MLRLENTEKYRLSDENIDAASEKIEKHLAAFSVDNRNVLRFRLMFEEILLNYRALGLHKSFKFELARHRFHLHLFSAAIILHSYRRGKYAIALLQ